MTPRLKMRIFAAIISMGFLTLSGLAFAGTAEPKEASGDQTRKEFSETLQAIKDFAAEQREEAVKQAKIALEEIDAAIESLEERFDRNWDQMDQAARKKSRDTLKSLKKQRNELSEWYGGLKHSSVKAWGHVKGGLLKSYQSLKEAFRKAEKEFK